MHARSGPQQGRLRAVGPRKTGGPEPAHRAKKDELRDKDSNLDYLIQSQASYH